MNLFQQILWMIVKIRLLGRPPSLPLAGESLIHYAAVLELQYSRIYEHLGPLRRHEVADIAGRIVGLLGLTEAAEPLPPLRTLVPEETAPSLTPSPSSPTEWPAQPGGSKPLQAVVHRALTQARTAGNLVLPRCNSKCTRITSRVLRVDTFSPGHWILLSEESARLMVSSASIN